MATLLSKVRGITKSTTSETTDNQVVNFLNAGSNFTVMSMPKNILWFLASNGSAITDGNGQAVSEDVIFEVKRNGITCDKVPTEIAYQSGYSGSLFEATAFFPKYYIRAGRVYIKPDPSVSAQGIVTTVSPPTIDSSTDSDSITYSQIENIIINYAAALDFTALANYYSRQVTDNIDTGDARDALDKAKLLIDGTETTNNAQDWIDAEDSEMTVAVVQTAQQEVQRAIAEINTGKDYTEEAKAYFAKADFYFKLAQQELSNYVNSNPEIMAMQAQQAKAQEK